MSAHAEAAIPVSKNLQKIIISLHLASSMYCYKYKSTLFDRSVTFMNELIFRLQAATAMDSFTA